MPGKDLFVWAFGQGSCLLSLLEVLLLPKSQKLNKRGTPPTCFLERYALMIVQFSQQEEVLPLAVELWLSTKLPVMPSVIRYQFISFPSLSPSMLCELGRCAWRKVGTRIWCCDGASLHSTLAVVQPQARRWHLGVAATSPDLGNPSITAGYPTLAPQGPHPPPNTSAPRAAPAALNPDKPRAVPAAPTPSHPASVC
jgi:hypothetical protein